MTMAKKRAITTLAPEVRQNALRLGLLQPGPQYEPYIAEAEAFFRAQAIVLAQKAGGGEMGPAPASVLKAACQHMVVAHFYLAEGTRLGRGPEGDICMSIGLRASRDHAKLLREAHELCELESRARPKKRRDLAEALEVVEVQDGEAERPDHDARG
jgi:hypothetical protein